MENLSENDNHTGAPDWIAAVAGRERVGAALESRNKQRTTVTRAPLRLVLEGRLIQLATRTGGL